MQNSRRTLLKAGLLTAAMTPFMKIEQAMSAVAAELGASAEDAARIAAEAHQSLHDYPDMNMMGQEEVAMFLYPGMTMLDFVGPQYFFASMMGAKVHLVSASDSLAPVMGDTGFAVVPTMAMSDCPTDLDVLFVPGGLYGTVDAMNDTRSVDFLADRGRRARYVTSVCTGSLLLGQAGLLEGKKATSHWATRHLLPEFGATAVDQRLVIDGRSITGAGVSAGLDFGLAMLAKLRSEAYARTVQLIAEYDPEPVFHPDDTDPKLRESTQQVFASSIFAMQQAARNRR
ncbi:MAG: DJ-1/PfpI family protein [Pseudomonadota bacterium]